MMTDVPAISRDRARTQAAILEAALLQLADGGFPAFGINTIARRARCDKQLIYRYFGGMDGLTAAVGEALALRLQAGLVRSERPVSYAGLVEGLVLAFLDLLMRDPLLCQALAWEQAGPSTTATRLSRARGAVMAAWMQEMRGDLVPPPGFDAPAINALLIGAVQQFALSVNATGSLAGVSAQDGGHNRMQAALRQMILAAYGR